MTISPPWVSISTRSPSRSPAAFTIAPGNRIARFFPHLPTVTSVMVRSTPSPFEDIPSISRLELFINAVPDPAITGCELRPVNIVGSTRRSAAEPSKRVCEVPIKNLEERRHRRPCWERAQSKSEQQKQEQTETRERLKGFTLRTILTGRSPHLFFQRTSRTRLLGSAALRLVFIAGGVEPLRGSTFLSFLSTTTVPRPPEPSRRL